MERDDNLHRILLNKETPEPSENLEDRIMANIHNAVKQGSGNKKHLYLSWIFFIFGVVTGIMITTMRVGENNNENIFGINYLEKKLIIQIICTLVILLLFEKIYKATIEMKNKPFKM